MTKSINIILTLITFVATACSDNVSLDQLTHNPSKLVVYAFPTKGDTIDITRSATYPISGKMPTINIQSLSCTTNGIADRIISLGDSIIDNSIPIMRFAAIGTHSYGDRIDIKVKATDFQEAYGNTVIPQKPTIENVWLETSSFKGSNYPVVRLNMIDNMSTPYYAVCIEGKYKENPYDINNYMPLLVAAEPLLGNSSNTDIDLSDWDSNFYRNIYNFDNTSFNNGKASMHLYVETWLSESIIYRPHLFALSTEYNSMLRSLNDISNNDLGKYGLAFAYSTYTNVHGGYGCIGAYAEVVGNWLKYSNN